jgi:hypothetical protein
MKQDAQNLNSCDTFKCTENMKPKIQKLISWGISCVQTDGVQIPSLFFYGLTYAIECKNSAILFHEINITVFYHNLYVSTGTCGSPSCNSNIYFWENWITSRNLILLFALNDLKINSLFVHVTHLGKNIFENLSPHYPIAGIRIIPTKKVWISCQYISIIKWMVCIKKLYNCVAYIYCVILSCW